eukprot:TRINITY_DN90972_c0_g1_i1.p1 TRINITY_DN90972_c0_g1~~TRINITY_DN90972_c0_g1_i1.p1  ORF type:complete len:665 (-),score=227.56 TRINITY_DN90972_c0_g1_i1:327-2321(-)
MVSTLSADAPEFVFSTMNPTVSEFVPCAKAAEFVPCSAKVAEFVPSAGAVEFVPASAWCAQQSAEAVSSNLSANAPEFQWSPTTNNETSQDASYGNTGWMLNLDQYSDDSSSSEEDHAATKHMLSAKHMAAKLLSGAAASPVSSQAEPAAEPGLEGEALKPRGKAKSGKDVRSSRSPVDKKVKEIPQDPEVPAPWYQKESSKYPGRYYYVNAETGATTWKKADIIREAKVEKVCETVEKESSVGESEPEAEACVTADRLVAPVQTTVSPETYFAVADLLRWRHAAPESDVALPSSAPEASTTLPADSWRATQQAVKSVEGSWRARVSTPQSEGSDATVKSSTASSSSSSSSNRLQASENSFAAQMRARRAACGGATGSSMSPEAASEMQVARQVKALLNKLTMEKFPSISRQLCEIQYETASHVKVLIKEIFEKATTQHTYIEMYADLCELLHEYFQENPVNEDPKCAFKRLLLNECQLSFERNLAPPTDLDKLDEEERTIKEVRYKTRMLGNIRFVGALLARRMLASKVLIAILKELMADPTPEALETVAALLTVTGPSFDTADWTHAVELEGVFKQVAQTIKNRSCCARARCLLQDVLDLRASGWENKKPQRNEGPMTLQEVAEKVKEEAPSRNSPTGGHHYSTRSSWYSHEGDAYWSQSRW